MMPDNNSYRYSKNSKKKYKVRDTYKGNLNDFYPSRKDPEFAACIKELCKDRSDHTLLFITGKSNTGKTHFAKSLSGDLKEKEGMEVLTIHCETLVDTMLNSIHLYMSTANLVDALSQYDLVIIDEMEEISFREATQVEVGMIIHNLLQRGVKVIVMGLPESKDHVDKGLIPIMERYEIGIKYFTMPCLHRFDRWLYIKKIAKMLGLGLSPKEILAIGKEENMARINAMLNNYLVKLEKEQKSVFIFDELY